MENKPLRNDLFLYDLTIRVLAFWTTILFSLLFFTGVQASKKTEPLVKVTKGEVVNPQLKVQNGKE